MTQDLLLLHRTGPERIALDTLPGADSGLPLEAFSFMTCLRHIVLAPVEVLNALVPQLGPNDSVLRGEEAYRFLLEVVCGLHSPLVGETEVNGQFKTAVANFGFPATPWGSHLAKTFKALFEDAKKVRETHLKDLGSQSYGSVLRREVRGLKELHILGAGHLVQEILPWVTKESLRITVHCRDLEKATQELAQKLDPAQMKRLRLSSIDAPVGLSEAEAFVIAAPVSSRWIRSWLPADARLKVVADLRADSSVDRLSEFARVLELGEFMTRLERNQSLVQERKTHALGAIAKAALARARTVEYRPFGWDDVCA